ncbi:MAG: type II CAAX endopeptidase family protein [Pirellulales bacterium]
MNQLSTISTFKLFGRVALRRLVNRSTTMRFDRFAKAQGEEAAATTRTATQHRSAQISLLLRTVGLWFPLMTLIGTVGLSLASMFALIGAVQLEDSKSAAVLTVSQSQYDQLKKATEIPNTENRLAAIDNALASVFSGATMWESSAGRAMAKERFDTQGLAGFSPPVGKSQFAGELKYLSPAGRQTAMRAVGVYLAFLSLATFCVAFGLNSAHLGRVDPALTWLWQFPVSRRVLFSSKLVEYLFDSPVLVMLPIYYASCVWLCGASFLAGLGQGVVLGVSAGGTIAALRLAAETYLAQRVARRTRGMVVAVMSAVGSLGVLCVMLGSNAQFVVESFIKIANSLPAWVFWNPFTAGVGSDLMLSRGNLWWLVAPAVALVAASVAVWSSVALTQSGLATAQDSVRGSNQAAAVATGSARRSHLSTFVWKELLQLRREPEMLGQVIATPFVIGLLLYFSGYGRVIDFATKGGTNISIAILVAVSYLLMVAVAQTLTKELKHLQLLQSQPRPLADVVRSKARVWATIAIGISVPFIGAAIAFMPSEAGAILLHVPFLFASLWFLAELVFGLTALAASVTNEQTVRFRRTAMLPALVISNLSIAIYSGSLWVQLGAFVTLVILNAAIRERQLVELAWLSEPVEAPPKQVYPMHAILAIISFEAIMGGISGALLKYPEVSAAANLAISYIAAAVVIALLCWEWMRRNGLSTANANIVKHERPLRPIFFGLSASCFAGLAVTVVLSHFHLTHQLPANLTVQNLHSTVYDKWCLLVMWVVAAPLFEEWIVRGMLYRSLRRSWGVAASVALSAVLFATLHPAAGCVALVTLGVMTALAVEKTGRLWPSIVIHAGYNFMIWALWAM